MARRSSNLLLRVMGNGDDAKRALTAVKSELRGLAKETATAVVDVATSVATTKVNKLDAQLNEFGRRRETATLDVDAQITPVNLLRRELDELGAVTHRTAIDVQI